MSAGTTTAFSDAETFEARPESPSRLAWRRLKRDPAALVSEGVLCVLLFAVLPGFAIDLTIAWMDPPAAQAGTRGTTVGRIV